MAQRSRPSTRTSSSIAAGPPPPTSRLSWSSPGSAFRRTTGSCWKTRSGLSVSKGLLSPRGQPLPLGDVGERSALIARQKVGRAAVRSAGAARTRARRSAKWRWLAIAAVVVVTGSLVAGGAHWLLTSPRFAIAGVEVRGASRVSAERVVEAAGIPARANIFRTDPTTVTARLQAVPEILRADVIRELPNRVTILVEERRPFTLVSNGMVHWPDEGGRLLGRGTAAGARAGRVSS